MSRLLSVILLALGGYWILQNRFRVLNAILGMRFLRRFFVSSFLSVPFVQNKLMKAVFSGGSRSQSQY
ncbi:hypothetical protein [Robertmurraya sp. Marseille-Q9965]